jgi:hypothetical protein
VAAEATSEENAAEAVAASAALAVALRGSPRAPPRSCRFDEIQSQSQLSLGRRRTWELQEREPLQNMRDSRRISYESLAYNFAATSLYSRPQQTEQHEPAHFFLTKYYMCYKKNPKKA